MALTGHFENDPALKAAGFLGGRLPQILTAGKKYQIGEYNITCLQDWTGTLDHQAVEISQLQDS